MNSLNSLLELSLSLGEDAVSLGVHFETSLITCNN